SKRAVRFNFQKILSMHSATYYWMKT
ncbi:hypothetical protein D030_4983B, partial [Vibrio parahaemolyticus AQ3810]